MIVPSAPIHQPALEFTVNQDTGKNPEETGIKPILLPRNQLLKYLHFTPPNPEGQSEAFPAKPAAAALIAARVLAILQLLPDKQTWIKFSSIIIIIGEEN